jgi:hypothetical protein
MPLDAPKPREPLLVDTAAAAGMLDISPRMLRQLEARGEILSCRIGRLVRYSPAALEVWILSRSAPSGAA